MCACAWVCVLERECVCVCACVSVCVGVFVLCVCFCLDVISFPSLPSLTCLVGREAPRDAGREQLSAAACRVDTPSRAGVYVCMLVVYFESISISKA